MNQTQPQRWEVVVTYADGTHGRLSVRDRTEWLGRRSAKRHADEFRANARFLMVARWAGDVPTCWVFPTAEQATDAWYMAGRAGCAFVSLGREVNVDASQTVQATDIHAFRVWLSDKYPQLVTDWDILLEGT